ncbi:efflux RND transporter permease subunit [Maritalea porphyrae]|uniref:Acriflavin resistance protein n=1 Tax=Maritalea porphyrae TaxID=880732 RepID=A0ABQ5USJ8_9HYPH|nr:efflux RND transporter permease subunit [Maritalea porphyrae]GLQ18091.1 acriflavin resistance protein [Maritalea porphyrae]
MIGALENILRRPKSVVTIMLVLLLAGISAYITLPKEGQPAIDIPYLYVSISQTGVSPSDAERLLARPMETELRNLDGLKAMTSTSSTGHASIFLEFDINFDKDQAITDVREKVDRAKSQLPEDANEPTVNEIAISNFPTVTVAVYGDVPERALSQTARKLQDQLEGIASVRSVDMSGHREEVLDVVVDLNKLESYNLTTNQLFDALARNNLVVPAGTLDTGQGKFAIEVPGLIQSASDVYNLPLKTDGSSNVTFGDVATIQRTFKDATSFTRVNGQPAIILGVFKRLGENVIELSDAVRVKVEETAPDRNPAIKTSVMIDQAKPAQDMLGSLQSAVLTAVALVMIVTIAMLGIRPALMIGLAIPTSFMMAFFFLQLIGMTVNMMIMFGLVLTVGMLVDGAIVIVEYADRKISEGMERREAFIRAAKLMFWPIVSSTGTTLAAFLPMLLWPGIIGKFMSYLPIMVIITLIASLITAMVFLPVIGGLLARKKVSEKEKLAAQALSGRDNFDPKTVPGFTGGYVRFLNAIIRRPIMVLVVGVGMIVGIFMYYGANSTGVEAFPSIEPEYATVAVTGRGNYSPVEIRDLLIEVETEVLKVGGIKEVVMNFGSTGAVSDTPPDTLGNLQLEFEPFKDRRLASEIFADIRENIKDIKGVGVELLEIEEGPPTGKDISMRVTAQSYDDLAPVVGKIRNFVEFDLGNTMEVEDGRPLPGIDWKINVNREMAALYGIGVRDLSPYVQLVTSGVNLGTYRPDDAIDELDIRVRLPKEQRSFEALDSLRIITNAGLVPVSNFITREAVPKVAAISRRDSKYTMGVRANVTGEKEDGTPVMAADKVEELKTWIGEQTWPQGVEFEFAGADEQTNETNAFMAQAGAAAMFLMFLILLTQFNSFYQVAITLSTVVMSVAGVLLGMLITGQSFSAIMTGVGIVSLAGIVVNNSIVLIDTYNRFRHEGADPISASLMTASQRLRPVLLTTITTVMGLIPMAMGVSLDFFGRSIIVGDPSGAWWIQLATAVISGLTFSTLLTLLMVPVLLVAPTVWKEQLIHLWQMITYPFRAISARRAAKAEAKAAEAAEAETNVVDQPATAEIPAGADSAKAYITGDLVTEEKHGVTIVSRPTPEAAE